jgi:hypothetical protein
MSIQEDRHTYNLFGPYYTFRVFTCWIWRHDLTCYKCYLVLVKIRSYFSQLFVHILLSIKTVSLCHGVYLDVNETDIFSSSKVCVKETAQ